MEYNIRSATLADAEQIRSIYAPYVKNTAVSFEDLVPDIAELQQRITQAIEHYSWQVLLIDDVVSGYAYASQFRARSAYRWTCEVTIYLQDRAQGKGLAEVLYQSLLSELKTRNFKSALAVITEPNIKSERLHQKLGFKKIGVFQSVGYKFDRWHDTGWWQREL